MHLQNNVPFYKRASFRSISDCIAFNNGRLLHAKAISPETRHLVAGTSEKNTFHRGAPRRSLPGDNRSLSSRVCTPCKNSLAVTFSRNLNGDRDRVEDNDNSSPRSGTVFRYPSEMLRANVGEHRGCFVLYQARLP